MDSQKALLVATNLLLKLGAPSNVRGYKFLRSAIIRTYDSPRYYAMVIYMGVAKEFGTNASNVERAIRYTIEAICAKGNHDELRRMFFQFNPRHRRIQNGVFITRLAEEMVRFEHTEIED